MSNYADNILDKDGNPIYLEDKHLNDQTSQTTVATTDAVMLKDTNGEYHSIAKASFNEAVRASLGSILTNFDKGSSITRIPGIDSNNDLGSVTAANLASVLGAHFNLHYSGEIQISAKSSGIFTMPSFGVFAIIEYGTSGAFGIFGVVGDTLTEINSDHYGVAGSSELFEISKSGYTYTITSSAANTTRHAVLGFVHI